MADRGWSGWTAHGEGAMDKRLSVCGLQWFLSAVVVDATVYCSRESGQRVAVCGDVGAYGCDVGETSAQERRADKTMDSGADNINTNANLESALCETTFLSRKVSYMVVDEDALR
jgi:hypothetical protein